MSKDKENKTEIGSSPLSANLNKSLASFKQVADLAVKNAQAENVILGNNNVKNNIRKRSRQTASNTLAGLASFKGFKGTKKKS
jgi:hypothetical protein